MYSGSSAGQAFRVPSGGAFARALSDDRCFSRKRIRVAGEQGRSVLMESTSPFTDASGASQKETDWLVTVPRPDGTVVL
ncbi:MAG: hypothetical protein ACP5M4_02185 [Acidobacteriaceae bacterium]